MKKHYITLTDNDRSELETMLAKGTLAVKQFKRATGLLELDRGKTLHEVASALGVNYNTVAHWRDGYKMSGLHCLHDAARSGRPTLIDGVQRAKITALAWSNAPDGHARWSLRLLAEKVVERGVCNHVSHSFVGDVFTKTS